MYDILDFDANFAAYLEKWMQMNKSKFKNIEQMEDAMPEVYMRWLNSPAAFLEGVAPCMYFEKFNDPQMLVNWVSEYEAALTCPGPAESNLSCNLPSSSSFTCAFTTSPSLAFEVSTPAPAELTEQLTS